ncbi:MAG: glyoxylate/hydroxypyruvate reductase A [Gammaproteobacteria bacterium]|nr:glyoxylate/hydroxypyruvate reductase A [Gammaproteobacteria bacterium]
MRILLSGSFDETERDQWLHELRVALPEAMWCLDANADETRQIEVAVVANPPPGALQGLTQLQLIQSLWAGVDRLLADPTVPPDVPIARMVDPAMNAAMAETTLWATLSLHRGFFVYARQQSEGLWRQLPQRRADEVQVALLGLGQMGRAAARKLASQGYIVNGWSQTAQATVDEGVRTCAGAEALHSLLANSDIVINLLPLTPATHGLLDRRFFAAMRPGASLVNLARGAHVVDDDLLAALDSGQVGHAVLDAFPTEPLPPGHRYWRHPQVTLLPHAAAQTDPRSAARVAAENVRAWRDGRPIAHRVERARGY